MRTSTGSISVTKIVQKKKLPQREAEVDDRERRDQRDRDLADRDDQRRDQAVGHHLPDRRRRVAGAAHERLAVVLEQVRAGQQRHRRRQHLLGGDRRRDERDVDRERDDDDAEDQHEVRDEVEHRAGSRPCPRGARAEQARERAPRAGNGSRDGRSGVVETSISTGPCARRSGTGRP
jgi:hypothetical protein